jgi:hypothetical protein
MAAEVLNTSSSLETDRGELDLFEMDQVDPDKLTSASSVEFILTVLDRFGSDTNGNEESR